MNSNRKLTGVIKGRTIQSTQHQNGLLTIGFDDGSKMTVKTAGDTNSGVTGGTIKSVRQQDTNLALDFTDGTTMQVQTAEATSSVMLRDSKAALEYVD